MTAASGTPMVLGGRYEVGRLLGSGGMARVHAARDLLLGREVAVKIFRRGTVERPDVRLQEIEARVVGALNHSALTSLFDAGVDATGGGEPQIYLVMEYVRGATLRDRLQQGPLSVSEACWVGFALAGGLDHMHQAGFVHRDVKPANILISNQRSIRPIVAKLTDFGIAAAIGQPDLSEYTVGTAAYLSPERVEGRDAGTESDTYSLGLVLLEAMTGSVAFPGTVEQSAFARLDRDPTIPDEVPSVVADLIRRMTTRNPMERVGLYDVEVELQEFLVDDLIRLRGAVITEPPSIVTADPSPTPPQYDLQNSATDDTFDALLRLAARALAAPKLVLLVGNGDQEKVQAQHGWARGQLTTGLFANLDPATTRTQQWALTLGDHLPGHPLDGRMPVAAAAAPLVTHSGARIGTLAVFDDQARTFSPAELAVLVDSAALATHEIELRAAARRTLFDTP